MAFPTDSAIDSPIPKSADTRGEKSGLARTLGSISLGMLSLGVVGLGLHNLGNRYFWTDESSSFFTALGWPAPGQQPGGLAEIQQTLITFLDPGLYHLMIRAWSELFGTSIQSLRSLPFLFFALYAVALVLWYRRFKFPLIVASAGVAVMMLENITPFYAVEVRAYSASLAAAVILPLVALWLLDHPSGRRLTGFLAVGLFFGAMQYTAVSVNLATAALLLVGVVRARSSTSRLIVGVAALVIASVLPLIYLVTRGWPSGGAEADLDHVRTLVLAYMDTPTLVQTLGTNFLSFTALPRTVFLLLVPALLVISVMRRSANARPRIQRPAQEILELWLYVLVLTVSAALTSVTGLLPWVLGTRWSITEVAGIALSMLGLISLARQYAPRSLLKTPVIRTLGVLGLTLVVAVGSWRLWTYERPGDSQALDELVPVLVSGNAETPIVVDYWIFPDTRYWVEYSGEFEQWRQAWIQRGVASTDGFVKAGPGDVRAFLESSSDRMLLKDSEALDLLIEPLPADIQVVYPSEPDFGSPGLTSAPIVLVKSDSSPGSGVQGRSQ